MRYEYYAKTYNEINFLNDVIALVFLFIYCAAFPNSAAKYVDDKITRRFQNFSVCIGNASAIKLPKTQQKPLYITSAVTSVYLGILPKAVMCFFDS